MKDLSLHLLDIAQNSVKAGASIISITIEETETWLSITIEDNGCGMDEAFLARVTDPFCTTRTTRSVGLGIPLLKLAAEQCGGSLNIRSAPGEGTTLTVTFGSGHLDCPPLGDVVSTVVTLIQGAPDLHYRYLHRTPGGEASLDTAVLREVLGEGISLAEPDVLAWMTESLGEEERALS